jgi:tubulin-specific chaperone A
MKQASTESGSLLRLWGFSVEDMINTNPLDFMLKFQKEWRECYWYRKTLDSLVYRLMVLTRLLVLWVTIRHALENWFIQQIIWWGTSLINEYDIKNNNLAATTRISKRVSGWFSSESFIKWLYRQLIGLLSSRYGRCWWKYNCLENTLVFTAKVLAITAAMITNVGWQKLVALWTTRSADANLYMSWALTPLLRALVLLQRKHMHCNHVNDRKCCRRNTSI